MTTPVEDASLLTEHWNIIKEHSCEQLFGISARIVGEIIVEVDK